MENALLVGLSRQVALSRELEIVSNNIANLNTTGFKSDGAVFEEFLSPTARSAMNANSISFVRDRATWHDFSAGPIDRTGNPLDVAIDGKGFLVVQTPRGERYTRNGALQINASGELVTSEGHKIVGDGGPIQFQPTDTNVSIAKDGTISVQEGAQSKTSSLRGKLRLVSFDQQQRLLKDGSSSFATGEGQTPADDTASSVIQGSVEKSNVRGVIEMTRMIEITRSYTQVAGILQQQTDMRKNAIDKLSDVPA